MRILVIYRYYWPDTAPFGRVIAALAKRWQARGHEVTVISGQPGYKPLKDEVRPRIEVHEGVTIYRTRSFSERRKNKLAKFANHFLFAVQAFVHAGFRRKHDVLIVNSYPPILGGYTARLASAISGKPYVFSINDIHPESAELAGYLKKGLLYRVLQRLDVAASRKGHTLVTMSRDMANTLRARGVARYDIKVLNVLMGGDQADAAPPPGFPAGDAFVVLFAGNMGRFQGLDTVIDAARLLKDNAGIRFVLLGDGAQKDALRTAAGDMVGKTVQFLPFAPADQAAAAMREADLGIVSLRAGIYQVAYPSKTMAYLSAGCPVLGIIEEHSALAREVVDEKLGVISPQGDAARLAQTIEAAWADRADWRARHDDIRAYAARQFDLDAYETAWCDLVEAAGNAR